MVMLRCQVGCRNGEALFASRRWMQRAARSCFVPSTVGECTFVLAPTGAEARHEIARDAPPNIASRKKSDNIYKKKEFL